MALDTYKEKRNFKTSPEPKGGSPEGDKLRFVIQKHDARGLHYDFRLEMEGVLKSWAVPKGPSTDPDIKRLAIMTEDHPYDYRNFEGIIPSGYGAGTVIVWDEGFYELAGANGKDRKTQDEELQKGIPAGKLHVVLHGKKLKGEYALVKTTGKAENAWLFFKVKDKHVSIEDVRLKDKSVISKKTLAQVEKTSTNFREAKRETSGDKIVSQGKRSRFPSKISPMLATRVDKPFDKEGWQYEIKWDGYRAIAFCNKDKVALKSRNDKSYNEKFYPVINVLQQWNIHAVVDGEVVVLDEDGKPDFSALQNWRSEADGELYFYVFDLLWLKGKDLMQIPLSDRRTILKQNIPENSIIRFSENFEVSGTKFFETAEKMGLEGIMAKKADSLYSAGNRSKAWLKIKAIKRQEMVIGGYTKNEDSSKSFSSLLLGVFEKGKLIYTGKAGTGFTDLQQKEMLKEAADAEKTKLIEIINFVDEREIDSLYYEQPYYLEPEKGAQKAYALLRDALESSGKVGVTMFVLRNKESLAILKPYKNVIVLNRIRFSQEIRETTELKLPPVSKTKTKEMDMANKLVEQLTEKFNIDKYKDSYTAKLLKIIKQKSKGKKVSVPKAKVAPKQNDNLMEMLKASLAGKN